MYPKPRDAQGHLHDSLGDLALCEYFHSQGHAPVYNALLDGADGRIIRRADFTWWCPGCGHDAIVWEHLGMYDDPGYRHEWETKRKPTYERNRGRYLLFESYIPLDLEAARKDLDEIEDLLANGGEKLHAELAQFRQAA